LITVRAQSGSPHARKKSIELLEEMRDKYKLNVSQSVFMAIAKLMIDEGLLNETYIFFETAKVYLEKKGQRITPGFWFQILNCCRLDKNEEKESEYFEQVKKNGCITDFILLLYANIFEKQPSHVLNVFEQVLFSGNTVKNLNLTLCRNSPKLLGHYLMLLVELGEYEKVWNKARELLQNIMDYAKEHGEEALSVLNISPIQNTLIKCAIKQKNYKRARNIYKIIKREHRHIEIYDSMLEVFANLGDSLSAVNMIREMLAENVDPDERFIFKYLKMFLDTGDGKTALQQWAFLHKSLPHIRAKYKPNGTLRSPNKWINDPKNIMKEQYPLLQNIVKRCYNLEQFPSSKHPQIEY
jgi:pentatricopeptide repeat protein